MTTSSGSISFCSMPSMAARVPVRELGVGTSSITLFQQVGGTVGLAITGSIFGSTLLAEMPKQIAAEGVPADLAGQFAQGGGAALNNLSGVGDLGTAILHQVPPDSQEQIKPLIPAIVAGIHDAFSLAIASTFTVGIVTALIAAVIVFAVLPRTKIGTGPA